VGVTASYTVERLRSTCEPTPPSAVVEGRRRRQGSAGRTRKRAGVALQGRMGRRGGPAAAEAAQARRERT
jgi:hypothetical protein